VDWQRHSRNLTEGTEENCENLSGSSGRPDRHSIRAVPDYTDLFGLSVSCRWADQNCSIRPNSQQEEAKASICHR
jgi:hypothetical protein